MAHKVVHYKSKETIFEGESPLFALLAAAGTERTDPTPEGGLKLRLESVEEFVNGKMLALHQFMHEHLAIAVTRQTTRLGQNTVQVGRSHRITCIGIQQVRQHNAL